VTDVVVAAVDIGASSGRVMLGRVGTGRVGTGRVGTGRLDVEEVHRFTNEPIRLPSGLHWDAVGLFRETLTGLRAARAALRPGEVIESIGIDSWAVDYGLLDARGDLLGAPFCYRDARTSAGVERVHAVVSPAELYAVNGLQFLAFNTLYQLAAEMGTPRWDNARTVLLIPDLLGYWLTGEVGAEWTNATTTGLVDAASRAWSSDLAERLDIPAALLPPLRQPGDRLGTLLPSVVEATGIPASTPVIAVGSHDTASAVAAVPAAGDRFAYISSGTWSLVGVELPAPVLSEASRVANFTNEGGIDATTRYLHNVMGLWLLNECLRTWERAGSPTDLARLLVAASDVPDGGPVIDPDNPVFLAPGDMPARLADACRRAGQPVPADRPTLVRCIFDSLATVYARTIDDIRRLCGRDIDALHIVGGGANNALLCRLTARATQLPVVAGPVEATAVGNILVQARAVGALVGDLPALRRLVRDTQAITVYPPDRRPT
jgi:rhamnulokinase